MLRKGPSALRQNGSVRLVRGSFHPHGIRSRKGAARSPGARSKRIERFIFPIESGSWGTVPSRAGSIEHLVVQPDKLQVLVEALRVFFRGRHEIRLIAQIQPGLLQQLGHHGGAGAMHADDRDGSGMRALVGAEGEILRPFVYRVATRSFHEYLEPTSPARHRSSGEWLLIWQSGRGPNSGINRARDLPAPARYIPDRRS